MRQLIIITLMCLFGGTAIAQNSKETIQKEQSQVTQVLASYFAIKDALVNDSRSLASTNAEAFVQKLKTIDINTFHENERRIFIANNSKLESDARKIAQANKIEEQRSAFASLSFNMWEVLKTEGHQQAAVYQQYCPMKKAYWIGKDSTIKNPYFGKQMLTCGKVTETLK